MNNSLSLWQRLSRVSSPLALNQTLTYYAAFVALGLTTASLGPTLLGLADQTGSTLSQISYLFTARSFGYLLGSFTGGRLYDRLPGHRTMAAALFVIAAVMALLPTASLLWLLIVGMLVLGGMEAVIDVGANTLIVWIHRERVAPYMNALHLFFAVGAFLSPILVAQVILFTGNFGWSYWLLALLLLPAALRLLPLPSPQPIVNRQEEASVRPDYILVVLTSVFLFAVSASEASFGGWVFTYAVKTNLADETMAAYATAAFWGAFMLARIVSIPLATRLRPRYFILGELAISLAGILLMLFVPASPTVLWVGTALFGFGIAPLFPSILNFSGRHMTITGKVTGWFFVGASLGSMILPWTIGQLFEPIGAWVVLVLIGAAILLGFIDFAIMLAHVNRRHVAEH